MMHGWGMLTLTMPENGRQPQDIDESDDESHRPQLFEGEETDLEEDSDA